MRIRNIMVVAVLVAGAPLAAACAGGRPASVGPGGVNDVATRRITANSQQLMEAFARRDGRAVAEFYVADGQFLFPDGRSARGQAAIADSLDGWFRLAAQRWPNYRFQWTIDEVRVADSGELAFESGRFTETWDGGRRGGPYVVVWEYDRRLDLWKILKDIANDP